MKEKETVLCVDRDVLESVAAGSGFIEITSPSTLFDPLHAWFIPRGTAEEREDFKQLIPYVLLTCRGQVAAYRRTKAGGEDRLHEKWSVGFGGHVGLVDAVLNDDGLLDVASTLARAGKREVDEEVVVGTITRRTPLGLIYDDRDPVGRVHLGIVELWELDKEAVHSAEDAVAECRFLSLSELSQLTERLEGWSQLCVQALGRALGEVA